MNYTPEQLEQTLLVSYQDSDYRYYGEAILTRKAFEDYKKTTEYWFNNFSRPLVIRSHSPQLSMVYNSLQAYLSKFTVTEIPKQQETQVLSSFRSKHTEFILSHTIQSLKDLKYLHEQKVSNC